MGSIKKIIQNKMINPDGHNRKSLWSAAQVVKGDEKNNVCEIDFIDKDGNRRNKKNVKVMLYGGSSNWFPADNDFVMVEDRGSQVFIVDKFVGNYRQEVSAKQTLTKDVHSDANTSTAGGCIF